MDVKKCDRCGAVYKRYPKKFGVTRTFKFFLFGEEINSVTDNYDLCNGCSDKLEDFLSKGDRENET